MIYDEAITWFDRRPSTPVELDTDQQTPFGPLDELLRQAVVTVAGQLGIDLRLESVDVRLRTIVGRRGPEVDGLLTSDGAELLVWLPANVTVELPTAGRSPLTLTGPDGVRFTLDAEEDPATGFVWLALLPIDLIPADTFSADL